MTRTVRGIPCGVLLAYALMSGAGSTSAQSPAVCSGEPCDAVARGLRAFIDRDPHNLAGNGRSCADCHMPTDNFQLSPSGAEARFQLLQLRRKWDLKADDPLFRPIDADDFRINGVNASDFSNLRKNGLIRISFPLPPNMRLLDPATNQPSTETFVDVWRAVPTVNDVALTGADGQSAWPRGPNTTGGYQIDARFANLQEQARGALTTHAEIGTPPPQQLLNDLASFQRVLFTTPGVRNLANALRTGTSPLPDPDPPLSDLEKAGKAVFIRACAHCHGGPGQSTTNIPLAPVPLRYHDIATQCPRPIDSASPARFVFAPCPERLDRNARTYQITLANGAKILRTSSDPGRALLTGFVAGPARFIAIDDWNKLDVPGLRGIRHTAPYFHNNSAGTLEEVVDHYIAFFDLVRANAPPNVVRPVGSTDGLNWDRQPRPEERAALLAYLQKL